MAPFLIRTIVEQSDGQVSRAGTQIIGWDPRSEHIRSWDFNADGSFGDGTWSKNGGDWLVKSSQTLASGEAASGKDVEPSRVLQLAVSKDGIVSGTLYNTVTDEAQSVQGQVDKETQRVAVRIGESEDIVAETGLYNLTQEESPVLVHFGSEGVENWLLVRLEQPEESEEPTDAN